MIPDPTIDAYDFMAERYERTNAQSIWTSQIDEFKRQLSGKDILEIGCGPGRDAASFIEEGYAYVGIDASKNLLSIAKRRFPRGDFRLMDFNNVTFEPHSFDGFLAIASLLHVPKNNVGRLLKSIATIIRPNGTGLVTMRKGEGEGWREKEGHQRYFAFYTADEFRQELETSGYSVVRDGETKEPDGTPWLYFFVKRT